MKLFHDISLKKRLVLSFAGVVILAAALSSIVFIVILVSTMKQSAKEKMEETSKVALTHVDDVARGLEIYADLISSDMTFGQVLSFDSSMGIQQKITDFTRLSKADVVSFVPRPEQYVSIKDEIFVNMGNESIKTHLKESTAVQGLLEPFQMESKKGWIKLGEHLYLYAMKPVLHFGSNMGVVFLARQCNDLLTEDLKQAAGTEITIFNATRVHGSTLKIKEKALTALPRQAQLTQQDDRNHLEEDYLISEASYLTLFVPLMGAAGTPLATLALKESNVAIQRARNATLQQVLVVALLATLFSAVIGYLLARAISNPLLNITRGINAVMEKGDLGIRIPGTFGAEIGILKSSFNKLLEQLQDAHEKLAASERRMKEELTMASTVQEMLFPERSVQYGNLEIASFIDTSTETGGDWYGYGKNRVGENVTVLVGDVTGHGMPAALITAITNGFFTGIQEAEDMVREALRKVDVSSQTDQQALVSEITSQFRERNQLTTADMLEILNQILLRSTKGTLLMTFFASVYQPLTAEIRYANAGHNRPFLCRPKKNARPSISVLPSDPSHRLGEESDIRFVENRVDVKQDDVIIWYTDGILECENDKGDMYGKRRIMNILRAKITESAAAIRDALIEDAYSFYGDVPRKDDITLVVGKVG